MTTGQDKPNAKTLLQDASKALRDLTMGDTEEQGWWTAEMRRAWKVKQRIDDALEDIDFPSAKSPSSLALTENDEPLRELCFDYRNAATAHAENYFQRIVRWVKQQEVRSSFAPAATETMHSRLSRDMDEQRRTYDAVADAVNDVATEAHTAFVKAGLEPGEWDGDNIVEDVKRGIVACIEELANRSTPPWPEGVEEQQKLDGERAIKTHFAPSANPINDAAPGVSAQGASDGQEGLMGDGPNPPSAAVAASPSSTPPTTAITKKCQDCDGFGRKVESCDGCNGTGRIINDAAIPSTVARLIVQCHCVSERDKDLCIDKDRCSKIEAFNAVAGLDADTQAALLYDVCREMFHPANPDSAVQRERALEVIAAVRRYLPSAPAPTTAMPNDDRRVHLACEIANRIGMMIPYEGTKMQKVDHAGWKKLQAVATELVKLLLAEHPSASSATA